MSTGEELLERILGKKTQEELDIEAQIEKILAEREIEDQKWQVQLEPLRKKLHELAVERAKTREYRRRQEKTTLTDEQVIELIRKHAKAREDNTPESVKKLIEEYSNLSESEKFKFQKMFYRKKLEDDDEVDVFPPLCDEKSERLLYTLVQTVVDFLAYEGLTDIEEVHFGVDNLKPSTEVGQWVCFTDASVNLYTYKEDEHGFTKRVHVGGCL